MLIAHVPNDDGCDDDHRSQQPLARLSVVTRGPRRAKSR
jgi:hypothetical protein